MTVPSMWQTVIGASPSFLSLHFAGATVFKIRKKVEVSCGEHTASDILQSGQEPGYLLQIGTEHLFQCFGCLHAYFSQYKEMSQKKL